MGPSLNLRVAATPADWAQVLAIRLSVFVFEQQVPLEEEHDVHDPEAVHLLAFLDDRPVGTGRYYVADGRAVIGRMAVLPWARGRGVGSAILAELVTHAARQRLPAATLAAQLHARPFYGRHGFVAGGPHFLDGGIVHQQMEREL